MKRKIQLLSLIQLIILSISSYVFAAKGPNVILNPGFEQGLSYWSLYGDGEVSTQEAYSGSNSLHMRGNITKDWNAVCTSMLSLQRGQTYVFGIWCKVVGEGIVTFAIRDVSSAGGTVNYHFYPITISQQGTWFHFNKEITTSTNPNVASFQVYLIVDQYFNGDIWFDDATLEEYDVTPPNPPSSVSGQRNVSSIQLSWQPPIPAADGDLAEGGYNIYRSLQPLSVPDEDSFLAHTMNLAWEDTRIERNTYYYLVTSIDNLGNESETGTLVQILGGSTVSGRVTDQFGQPLSKVKVSLLEETQEVTTDDNGIFTFPLIIKGNYVFRASKVGYRWQEIIKSIEEDRDYYLDFCLIEDNREPPPPKNLRINANNPGMLVLNWEPPDNLSDKTIAGFNIYRSRNMFNDKSSAELVAEFVEVLTWSDLTVKPELTYWYSVTLVDTALQESPLLLPVAGVAIAPPKPQNTSPASGEKYIDQPVIFSWVQLENVDYYELELSRDESFSPSNVLLIKVYSNSYSYKREINYREAGVNKKVEIGLPDGKWYWRVRAVFLNGVHSQESEPFFLTSINTKFNIDSPEPGSVQLNSITKGLVPFSIPFLEVQPPVLSKEQTSSINFLLNSVEPCQGEVRILNSAGKIIYNHTQSLFSPGLLHSIPWNGVDNQGRKVPNGLYIIQVNMSLNNQRVSSDAKVIVLR